MSLPGFMVGDLKISSTVPSLSFLFLLLYFDHSWRPALLIMDETWLIFDLGVFTELRVDKYPDRTERRPPPFWDKMALAPSRTLDTS